MEQERNVPKKSRNKKKKIKKVITTIIILIAVVAAILLFINKKSNAPGMAKSADYMTQTVAKNDIKVELTGSGTLKPANSYTVTGLVSGEILSASFEEGDMVNEDTVLYEIDSSDAKTSLEKAELNVSQNQKNYDRLVESTDDLNIKANESGTVVDISVEVGDEVQSGQTIATIRNQDIMSITLAFGSDDVENFYLGQNAVVTMESTYENLQGTVSDIKNVEETIDGYKVVKKVTIDVKNPGGLSTSDKATAVINESACMESANFTYKAEGEVKAKTSGEIASISIKEGDNVTENQLLFVLESTSIQDNIESSERNLKDSELSLKNQYENLDDYTIKSPISGTVVDKYYKAGDKLEPGKSLCTIFDLSYLTMTLNIDELDIAQIELGQKVNITAEAAENKSYVGEVTKISINGTTTNGVTVYPVTIRIDEIDGLLPGMNVDASIEVVSKENVLSVPIAAVARGNRVLVKTQTAGAENSQNTTEQTPSKGENSSNKQVQESQSQEKNPNASPLEGYEYVKVEVGISNDDYIEIISGLKEGDEIAVPSQVTNQYNMNDMMMMPGMTVTAPSGNGQSFERDKSEGGRP